MIIAKVDITVNTTHQVIKVKRVAHAVNLVETGFKKKSTKVHQSLV